MKKDEKDYEYLETPPDVLKRGLRYITRPKSLDRILSSPSGRDSKSRITTFMDADIVDHFKKLAAKEGKGYQTLINQALREIVDAERQTLEKEDLKKELLSDKKFLQKLKTALSV